MKIYSQDEKGRKVEIEYEQRVLDDDEYEAPLTIKTYEQYKHCVKKHTEQFDYVAECRNMKYGQALDKLIRDNHDLYMEYKEKLDNEYRESQGARYGR